MDTRQEYPRQTEYYILYKTEDTVYKTEMPYTPAVDEEAPVIIVGAGPSGLAAAWRLTRHGRPVLVLEARNRIGGQVNTRREAGYLMEEGATILPSRYEPVMRLVREAGIVDQLIPAGSVIGFARDGKIHDFRSEALAADALKTQAGVREIEAGHGAAGNRQCQIPQNPFLRGSFGCQRARHDDP